MYDPRRRRLPAVLCACLLIYFAPYLLGSFALALLTNVLIAAIAVLGLNVLFGYTGQISIGHAAFLGIGAYTSAVLVERAGFPYPVAIGCAMAAAFLVGMVVAVPALRLKGLYLALLTLALGAVFPGVVRGLAVVTNGDLGMFGVQWRAPGWTGLYGPDGQVIWMFWVSGLCLLVCCVLIANTMASAVGRSLVAVRDNDLAAASAGISVARTKALAFAVAGALGALAGGLSAASVGVLTPGQFGLLQSIELIVAVVVGGVASVRGSVLGGVFYVVVPYYAAEFFSGAFAGVVFAVAIIVVLFFAPHGIDGLLVSVGRRLRGSTRSSRRSDGRPIATSPVRHNQRG